MGDVKTFLALAMSAPLALLFLFLGLPLFLEKIKPNYVFGYRISRYALLDEEIWYQVNKHGGGQLLIIGGLLILNSILAWLFLNKVEVQKAILNVDLVVIVGGSIYSLISGILLNKRLAREKGLDTLSEDTWKKFN
jgi:hypothetical protein